MSEDIRQSERIDLRRVIDRLVCNWVLSGHAQSLQMMLPCGPLHALGNSVQLHELLLRLMDSAGGSASRFDTMSIVVECCADHMIIHVGVQAGAGYCVSLSRAPVDTIVRSSRTASSAEIRPVW